MFDNNTTSHVGEEAAHKDLEGLTHYYFSQYEWEIAGFSSELSIMSIKESVSYLREHDGFFSSLAEVDLMIFLDYTMAYIPYGLKFR